MGVPLALRLAGQGILYGGTGLGLFAGVDSLMNLPENRAKAAVQRRLDTDPDDFSEFDKSDLNIIDRILIGGDRENLDEKVKTKRQKQIKEQTSRNRNLLLQSGDPSLIASAAINRGETLADAEGRLAALVPQAEAARASQIDSITFDTETAKDARGARDLQMQMLINSNERQIQETIDSRVGNQRLQEMQLLQMRENQADKMDLYRQQMTQKGETDRYRTTAGLIGGLSALGAAFAL